MTQLVRTLRLRDLLLLFVGSVIGSGIFLAPGMILQRVQGSVGISMMVWLVGGILSLMGALTYSELAAANPEAGGIYCYIRDGFGRLPAFLYGWCLFLVIAGATIAALARAFVQYLAEIIPLTPLQQTLLAVLMIAVVTAVNIRGTRHSATLQNWTTIVKVGLVVLLSAVLLSLGHHGSELGMTFGTPLRGFPLLSGFGLAMIAVLWAYEGWQFGTYTAGEVLEPQKVFPKAFLAGSLILIGLYIVAVFGYLVALGPVGGQGRRGDDPDFGVQLDEQRHPDRAAGVLRDVPGQSLLQDARPGARQLSHADGGHSGSRRMGDAAHLRGKILRTGRRSHLHRLDFLWPGRRCRFPVAARFRRKNAALSRTGISVDAAAFRAGRDGSRRQRRDPGVSRSRAIPQPGRRAGSAGSRIARLLLLATSRQERRAGFYSRLSGSISTRTAVWGMPAASQWASAPDSNLPSSERFGDFRRN